MKKFFGEFKKFITRGNVLDLAVGVIIGSAFTAIVTALTKNILQPLINGFLYFIFGGKGTLEGVYTFLVGNADNLTAAIYIDWGAFVGAIINFLLVALVLFCIVKAINKLQESSEKMISDYEKIRIRKADRIEMKKLGLNKRKDADVKAYLKIREERLEAEKAEAERKAEEEKLKNPTTEMLLKDIRALLQNSAVLKPEERQDEKSESAEVKSEEAKEEANEEAAENSEERQEEKSDSAEVKPEEASEEAAENSEKSDKAEEKEE